MISGERAPQTWSPEGYDRHARFVSDLGADILSWLAPQAGEAILDIGCGDGVLTEKIAAAGAKVTGVDQSPDMVEAARRRGIEARVLSGEKLDYRGVFDAVFSNAALHWMHDASAVARGVEAALKPGGRFVAEFGGHTNVASIATALQAALGKYGGDPKRAYPWYFPSEADYAAVLDDAGLNVVRMALVPRPTPLPTGMANWLETFLHPYLDEFSGARRDEVVAYIVGLLEPSLCDEQGNWTADYVRLRVEARKA